MVKFACNRNSSTSAKYELYILLPAEQRCSKTCVAALQADTFVYLYVFIYVYIYMFVFVCCNKTIFYFEFGSLGNNSFLCIKSCGNRWISLETSKRTHDWNACCDRMRLCGASVQHDLEIYLLNFIRHSLCLSWSIPLKRLNSQSNDHADCRPSIEYAKIFVSGWRTCNCFRDLARSICVDKCLFGHSMKPRWQLLQVTQLFILRSLSIRSTPNRESKHQAFSGCLSDWKCVTQHPEQ